MWTSAPPAGPRRLLPSGPSRPEPGNSGFYPPSALRGRTGALVRGICLCQMSPVSGDSCARAPWPGSGGGNSIASLRLFAVHLADSRTRVRAALSPELKAWAGGILSWPRPLEATTGVKVLTTPSSVTVLGAMRELTCVQLPRRP